MGEWEGLFTVGEQQALGHSKREQFVAQLCDFIFCQYISWACIWRPGLHCICCVYSSPLQT